MIVVEISAGELIDKITILEIKLDRIADEAKKANVAREYEVLTRALAEKVDGDGDISRLRGELKTVNAELWDIEDAIRDHERAQNFDAAFIALARAVYRTNDRRAELKRKINLLTKSNIIEEKSYSNY